MALNLKNEYRHNIDAKNRLFIPAKHREQLGREFVVCRAIRSQCLRVYSKEGWDEYTAKLAELKGKVADDTTRFLYRYTIDGEPDAQGRVTLNDGLIRHAMIQKEAVILGVGKYAEIWAAELYDTEVIEVENENMAAIIAAADEVGL